MTDIYIAICNDRHLDLDIEVFTEPEDAISYARTFAREHTIDPNAIEEEEIKGRLYHASYGTEGDCAYVVSGILNEKEPPR